MEREWNDKISRMEPAGFLPLALELFRYQHAHNPLYRQYCDLLQVDPAFVKDMHQIPFLPIRFFKTHAVQTGSFSPGLVFESSGTTGMVNSRHLMPDGWMYEQSFRRGFTHFFGDLQQYAILGLLPYYLERGNSSLVYMVKDWVEKSGHPLSGFYLRDVDRLHDTLLQLQAASQPTILVGVTFALLDFAEAFSMPLKNCLILETGGMKGRRREMIRAEVHEQLKQAFSLSSVGSEYGMTELASQAYALADGRFRAVPWMKILLREEDDPLRVYPADAPGRGAINIIDLANLHSCAFLATDDAGRVHDDGSFEVLGRLDNADLRGCSLLVV